MLSSASAQSGENPSGFVGRSNGKLGKLRQDSYSPHPNITKTPKLAKPGTSLNPLFPLKTATAPQVGVHCYQPIGLLAGGPTYWQHQGARLSEEADDAISGFSLGFSGESN